MLRISLTWHTQCTIRHISAIQAPDVFRIFRQQNLQSETRQGYPLVSFFSRPVGSFLCSFYNLILLDKMREEIAAAVVFLSRLIRQNDSIPKEKAEEFSDRLSELLVEKFKDHWYAENPHKGQGYRCIRVNPAEPIDPVLKQAATLCGLKYSDLCLPSELTVWVDPQEVCCRFGETHGSFCMLTSLKDGNLENHAHKVDIGELVEEQQKRNNKHINIVTTRININMPRPMYHKSHFFHLPSFPPQGTHYHQINQYQQNFFQNGQHYVGFNPHPFHNNRHKNQNKGSFPGNYGGYHGNKAYSFRNYGSNNQMHLATNPKVQGKDKFRWVRGKQHRS